jgi:malate dehydrogenase (oxaloacetate-decarboxylating)
MAKGPTDDAAKKKCCAAKKCPAGGGKPAVEMKKVTKEELLAKAYLPAQKAMKYHPFYKGKIEVLPKCSIWDFDAFAVWYTPGVAEPCKAIHKNVEEVYNHTGRGNAVAVVSDGTRVLGLGDIGPEAAMPVMEGKAILFKYLGGVDAYPICLNTKDPEAIIQTVKYLAPTFGGINLEDISNPKCFYILDRLRAEMQIPVWHDDQQGTAAVEVAGLINAVKLVGKKLNKIKVVLVGAGAANIAIARIIIKAGVDIRNVIMVDSKGILHKGRTDIDPKVYADKWLYCTKANAEQRTGAAAEAFDGVDACIAASKPGPDTIKKEWITAMAKDSIVFATANPIPEIWPWDAKEAGAKVVATGRSDFPNQVNNSLGFPGIFRGALDVMAKTITDEMCIAAAYELAKVAEDKGLREDYIIPSMSEWEVYPREAAAVAEKAVEQGIARIKLTKQQAYKKAEEIIGKARGEVQHLMKHGFILPPPEM